MKNFIKSLILALCVMGIFSISAKADTKLSGEQAALKVITNFMGGVMTLRSV